VRGSSPDPCHHTLSARQSSVDQVIRSIRIEAPPPRQTPKAGTPIAPRRGLGTFPEKQYEYDKVTYLRADLLATWLQQQPPRLSEQQQETLTQAMRQIAELSTAAA
jgi:hypothetical protein